MSWFKTKEDKSVKKLPKMTENESDMYNIIVTLLENSETVIEYNPADSSYLLSLHGDYFLLISEFNIKFSNHGFVVIRNFESRITDIYLDFIKEETTKRREAKIEEIFKNECDLLKSIAIKIAAEKKD